MIIAVILIVAAVLVLLGYSLKLFRIERVPEKKEEAAPPTEAAPAAAPDQEEEEAGEDAAEEEPELVNLVDYYSDREKPAVAEEEPPPPVAEEEPVYDKLTGLLVERSYIAECNMKLAQAFEEGSAVAAVCFDIDRFRFINSVKGFSLGDYVLSHLAQKAAEIFPPETPITRVSADQFAAVFAVPETRPYEEYAAELRRFSEDIRSDIGVKSAVRICTGIAEALPDEGAEAYSMEVLMRKANLARHCMKISRDENFSLYNDSIATSNLYGESAMEDYNESQYGDEFLMYYQPVTDIQKGLMWGCDALARWACQENSSEPLTPENGHIPTGNLKVYYQVCKALNRWRKSGKDLPPMLLYIPETELLKADLDEFFIKLVSEFQLEAKTLVAVVDASVVRIHRDVVKKQLQKLADAGMQVCVSGFGPGTRSFQLLADLPVQYVKPSRAFAQGVHRSEERQELVTALLGLANQSGYKAIWEGVDFMEEMQAISDLGGQFSEGRYSGRAVPADDFFRMIDENSPMLGGRKGTVILTDKDFKRGDFNL